LRRLISVDEIARGGDLTQREKKAGGPVTAYSGERVFPQDDQKKKKRETKARSEKKENYPRFLLARSL